MTVTIRRLGHLGDGIADGPVFVPLTLPGEVVEGEQSGDHIIAPRIVTPSVERVKPPCSHFRTCGGCALQHGSDGFVAAWKADVVSTALAAHGLAAPIRAIRTSAPRSRRRATLSGRRTKKGAMVGFHARGSDVIVDIPNCQLLHPDIMALLPVIERLVALAASRKGEIAVSVTLAMDGAEVSVTGGKPLDSQLQQDLARLSGESGILRLAWDGDVVAQHRPPRQIIDGITLIPPAGAFLQPTKDGETALIAAVRDAVGPARRIADLFAGAGTFALPLARNAEVHAVESDAAMLMALDAAWRNAAGLKKVTTESRDLFRRPMLPLDLRGFDAAVIDPPRAGAEAQVAEIAQSGIQRLAMVSCNPVTFARDAKTLTDAGYSLDWIEVIDQFRWSAHVELVAQFCAIQ
ncbi:MAG: class I SAM-dependent RNA methyltransferase [Rhodobacter sp.]|nr:class I SAM-dependent RNA methyltransferase [Rhodobacter sp.]